MRQNLIIFGQKLVILSAGLNSLTYIKLFHTQRISLQLNIEHPADSSIAALDVDFSTKISAETNFTIGELHQDLTSPQSSQNCNMEV